MSKLEKEFFPIAKTCNIPGKTKLTGEVFDQIVKNFDPGHHEVPMIYGHARKEHNAEPSNGWIESVKVVGDTLYAKAKQVWNKFDLALREGRYKKRSIGLRMNEKGEPFLHHLGWLGAMAPAVKGMPNIYSGHVFEDFDSVENYDFSDNELNITKSKPIKRGNEMPVKEYSDAELDNIKKQAAEDAKKGLFSQEDVDKQKKDAAKVAEDKARKDFNDSLDAERHKNQFNADVTKWLDENAKGEKVFINPAMRKAGLLQLFSALNEIEDDLEFSDGDKKFKQSAVDILKNILKAHTVNPGGSTEDVDESGATELSDEAEYNELGEAIDEYMEKHPKVSYGTAMLEVRKLKKINIEKDRKPVATLGN